MLLPPSFLSKVLLEVEESTTNSCIELFPTSLSASILRSWREGGEDTKKKFDSVLANTSKPLSEKLNMLMSFPENSVGSVMNTAPFSVNQSTNVSTVIDALKKRKNSYCRYVYVLDDDHTLLGIVSFKEVFYGKRSLAVSSIMNTKVRALKPEQDSRDVLDSPVWRKWNTLPVTDASGKLLGILRLDSLEDLETVDLPSEKGNEELMKAGNAVAEVFQIGVSAALSAIGLSEKDQ